MVININKKEARKWSKEELRTRIAELKDTIKTQKDILDQSPKGLLGNPYKLINNLEADIRYLKTLL